MIKRAHPPDNFPEGELFFRQIFLHPRDKECLTGNRAGYRLKGPVIS